MNKIPVLYYDVRGCLNPDDLQEIYQLLSKKYLNLLILPKDLDFEYLSRKDLEEIIIMILRAKAELDKNEQI